MRRATVAAYLDLTPTEMEREVAAGNLPSPIRIGNADHWSKDTIDATISRMTGSGVDDWRQAQPLYSRQG
jgi:predicted DNA-binding transcriptional regulator AlpA